MRKVKMRKIAHLNACRELIIETSCEQHKNLCWLGVCWCCDPPLVPS